jgi:hypothetical protein
MRKIVCGIFLVFSNNLICQTITFNNPKDEFDVTNQMMQFLIHLKIFVSDSMDNKILFISNIENGVIFIDNTKYSTTEKDLINLEIDRWINFTDISNDKRTSDLTYDFGTNTDWDDLHTNLNVTENILTDENKKKELSAMDKEEFDKMFGGNEKVETPEERKKRNEQLAMEEQQQQKENSIWYSEDIFIEWLTAYSFYNYDRTVKVDFKELSGTIYIYVQGSNSGRLGDCELDGNYYRNYVDIIWSGKIDQNVRIYSNSEDVSKENQGTISGIRGFESSSLLRREGIGW